MAKVDLKVIEPWIEALWNAKGSDLLLSAGSAPSYSREWITTHN